MELSKTEECPKKHEPVLMKTMLHYGSFCIH